MNCLDASSGYATRRPEFGSFVPRKGKTKKFHLLAKDIYKLSEGCKSVEDHPGLHRISQEGETGVGRVSLGSSSHVSRVE